MREMCTFVCGVGVAASSGVGVMIGVVVGVAVGLVDRVSVCDVGVSVFETGVGVSGSGSAFASVAGFESVVFFVGVVFLLVLDFF